jgi:hypothetical protein
MGGNNDIITELFLPRGSLVSNIPAGDGKLVNLFLRCSDEERKMESSLIYMIVQSQGGFTPILYCIAQNIYTV